jgi:hypothetical protein
VRHEPTGIFARKAWYLYEGLTGNILNVPDLKVSTFVDLLDTRSHVVGPSTQVRRQRVNDNLLGDFRYSPIVRRTASLEQFRTLDLSGRSKELVESVDPVALARAINCGFRKFWHAFSGNSGTLCRRRPYLMQL